MTRGQKLAVMGLGYHSACNIDPLTRGIGVHNIEALSRAIGVQNLNAD